MLAVPDQNRRDKSDKPTLVSIENDKGLKQETYRHGQGFRIGEIGLPVKAIYQCSKGTEQRYAHKTASHPNKTIPANRDSPGIQGECSPPIRYGFVHKDPEWSRESRWIGPFQINLGTSYADMKFLSRVRRNYRRWARNS
jgi:hypothetical protein